jgi:hypothetical protein
MCRCLRKACPAFCGGGGDPQDFDININKKPNIYSSHNALKYTHTLVHLAQISNYVTFN